jgi:hypothetical protein
MENVVPVHHGEIRANEKQKKMAPVTSRIALHDMVLHERGKGKNKVQQYNLQKLKIHKPLPTNAKLRTNHVTSWTGWDRTVIPALGRLRQDEPRLQPAWAT